MSKEFLKMTPAQREADLAKFEHGVSFEQTRPLSPRDRALWELAKRSRGRPRKAANEKAARVMVSLNRPLLTAVEAFAAANGLDRSKLIALSLQAFLAADMAHRQAMRNDQRNTSRRRRRVEAVAK